MAEILPATPLRGKKDVFDMLTLYPLENVAKSLRKGDAHELATLRPFANRCRAVADAFEDRMKELNNELG